MKKQIAVILIVTLGLLEATLTATTHLWTKNLELPDPTHYTLTHDQIKTAEQAFDPILGWRRPHKTKQGERPRPFDYGNPVLLTFGDSFVYGDELNDQDTWQSQLAELLKRDVYNYGVSGFGPDQAYLYFQNNQASINAPFISMGMTLENINRVLNVYRKFYHPKTGLPLTKPRAILKGETLEFLPNPIQSLKDLAKLQDTDFIQELGAKDFWYTQGRKPFILKRPYTLNFLNLEFWKKIRQPPSSEIQHYPELWKNAEAVEIVARLLVQFSDDVRAKGATPLITILPTQMDIENRRTGQDEDYQTLISLCARKNLTCFDGIDYVFQETLKADEESQSAYWREGRHLSAQGNALLARGLKKYLSR